MSSNSSLQGITVLEQSQQPSAATGGPAARQTWAQLPMDARAVCPASPAVQFSAIEEPPLSLNDRLPERQLLAQSQAGSPAANLDSVGIELGYYDATHRVEVSAPLMMISTGGSYAVCIVRFEATIRSMAKIYVASELPAGSCPRTEIMNHEMGHYRIDREQIARLKEEAPQIAAQFSAVFWGATLDAARSSALAANQQFSDRLQRRLIDLRTPAQQAHDSPDEYQRLTRSCGGETQRIGVAASRAPN